MEILCAVFVVATICLFPTVSGTVRFEQSRYAIKEDIGLDDRALSVCVETDQNLVLQFATIPQTADDTDEDYDPLEETVEITPDNRCIAVIIWEDSIPEGDEDFEIALYESGVQMDVTTVTILDDDDITLQFMGDTPRVVDTNVMIELKLGTNIGAVKCEVLFRGRVFREDNCTRGHASFENLPPRRPPHSVRVTATTRCGEGLPPLEVPFLLGVSRTCSVNLINDGIKDGSIEFGLAGPEGVPSMFQCRTSRQRFRSCTSPQSVPVGGIFIVRPAFQLQSTSCRRIIESRFNI